MENKRSQQDEFIGKKKNLIPKYESPKVITYSEDELLSELGPAQACNPFGGSVLGC